MYLKKFILQGFKSFPYKTALTFTPGITVIVGPNGCGKSNICDALKWVLGEQSVKSLRGARMEDIIFNGARGQDPSPFSEVQLLFDNSDTFFPISHSEVSILRRLYRSGDSVYQLNKKNCRLKDIQSLLWGTGLGKNAYSVIEQGQIDQIVNAPVYEKRNWIEEAAGITRYRWRKNEALNQLEKVEQDLLRLGDILSEVKESLHDLKSQADKARRYKAIASELKNLELSAYYQQYDRINQKIEELEKNIQNYREEIEGVQSSIEEMTAQNETDRGKAVTFQKNYERLREERINLQNEIKHTRTLIKNKQARCREMEEEERLLNSECEELQERFHYLKKELASRDQYEEYIDRQTSQTGEKIASYRERLKKMEGQNKTYLEGLKEFEEKARQLSERVGEAEKKMAVLETNEEYYKQQENSLNRQKERDQQRYEKLEEEELTFIHHQNELEEKIRLADDDLAVLQSQYEKTEQKLEKVQAERMNCHMQLKTLESEKRVLDRSIEHYDGFYGGVRALMKEKKKNPDKWKDMKAVVADLIKVPPQYQVALEMVLGNALQFIVVNNADFCNICLDYLKKNRLGRVTFIPLDIIHVPRPKKELTRLKNKKGVVGEALELISYDSSASSAIQYLLNNTVVTETLDNAIALKKERFSVRFVSLDGELLNPSGIIVGGSHRSLGILERKNSLARLQERAADLQKHLDGHEKECSQTARRREELKKKLSEKNETAVKLKEKARDLQRDVQSLQQEKNELKQRLETHRKQGAQILIEKGQRSEEKIQLQNNLGQMRTRLKEIQVKKADFEKEFHGQGELHKELMQKLSHQEVILNSLKEKKKQFLQECTYKQQEVDRLHKEMKKNKERGELLSQKRQDEHREIEELKQKEDEKSERLLEVQTELSEVEKERAALHNVLEKLSSEISRLQRDENQWRNALSDEKINLAQWTTRREDLIVQVQDEYNVQLDAWQGDELQTSLSSAALKRKINSLKEELEELGEVNHRAIAEYEKTSSRYQFILSQEEDLLKSKQLLLKTIHEIDEICARLFSECYEKVRLYFKEIFRKLFQGGRADLYLLDEKDILGSGLDILASPPGKKLRAISLLSGGEKALTAIAFMFALFSFRPSPFCILDEIDAPLDEYNVSLLNGLIQEFASDTQFFIITHNKRTIENADTIYGVTMQTPGVSSVVSMNMQEARERLAAS